MPKRLRPVTLAAAAAVALAALFAIGRGLRGEPAPEHDPSVPTNPLPDDGRPVALNAALVRQAGRASYAAYGLRLFQQVAATEGERDAFVSPVSAGMIFALAATGAEGDTRAELVRTLGLPDAPDTIAAVNAAMRAALRSGDVELHVANSLWAKAGAGIGGAFRERATGAFGARAENVDFDDPATPKKINDWVSQATAGRIPTIMGADGDPERVLVLLNAVYFKGKWQDEFDRAATTPLPFHVRGGAVQPRPAMQRTGDYGYATGPGLRALRLPYRGGRFAMVVLLPDSGVPLARTVRELSAARWDSLMHAFTTTLVSVAMPTFKAEGATPLVPVMRALGVRRAFDREAAQLAPTVPGADHVWISDARQKVWVKVDEEGTEAAAVTMEETVSDSAGPARAPVPFIVDRPFVAAVVDTATGALLFVGQVYDPQAG